MKFIKDSKFQLFLLVSTILVSSSCSLMLPDRSFVEQMETEDDGLYNPGRDFPVVSGDTGEVRRSRAELTRRTPASERSSRLSKEAVSLTEELIQKEDKLSEEELDKYGRDKKFLQTDSDKLYYISLSPYERKTYIDSKKLDLKEDMEGTRDLIQKRSIHSGEIYIGMDKNEVMQVWGKPARVEIAGNPKSQNERWSFREDGNVKQVYFEGGKVQGWALDL
jgi:hypothetical protein